MVPLCNHSGVRHGARGSFSCPFFFFFFFLNGFFVPCPPPLPSLASVSDTIKGIGKDAGPAPARLQEECLTPLLPVSCLSSHPCLRCGDTPRREEASHSTMVDVEPNRFLSLLSEEPEKATCVWLWTSSSQSSAHPHHGPFLLHPWD